MNNIMNIFKCLTASAVLALIGCTSQYIQPQEQQGPNAVKINIIRPASLWGSALRAPIYVNNHYIGRIGSGGQLSWITKPGKVTVATSEGTAAILIEKQGQTHLTFDVRSGQTYTVRVISPVQIQFTAPFAGEAAFQLELLR